MENTFVSGEPRTLYTTCNVVVDFSDSTINLKKKTPKLTRFFFNVRFRHIKRSPWKLRKNRLMNSPIFLIWLVFCSEVPSSVVSQSSTSSVLYVVFLLVCVVFCADIPQTEYNKKKNRLSLKIYRSTAAQCTREREVKTETGRIFFFFALVFSLFVWYE